MISLVFCILTLIPFTSAVGMWILSPLKLQNKFDKGQIQSHLGNFGHIPYGHSIVGKVHYPVSNQDGCKPFKKEDFVNDPLFDNFTDMTPIVLMNAGGCTHVAKTMNVQDYGCKGALIEDDRWNDPMRGTLNTQKLVADEKRGYHLVIPYMKIHSDDSNLLIAHLKKKDADPIFLKIDLGLERPDNRVEYELWYSSILDLTSRQLTDLGKYQQPFGNDTLFTPRIITFSCPTCPKEVRQAACFSDGQYCPYKAKTHKSYDDDSMYNVINAFKDRDERLHKVAEVTADRELLLSSLREKCLYKKIANTDDSETYNSWFKYMVFVQMEIAYDGKLDKEQTDAGFKHLKIDPQEIEQCVNDSFAISGDYNSENYILKQDREWQNRQGIRMHPVVTINNQTYQGDFNGRDIAIALCASFKDRPEECRKDFANMDYLVSGYVQKTDDNGDLIYIIGAVIVFLNICLVCYHKRTSKKDNNSEINIEVNQAVASYFALRGDEQPSKEEEVVNKEYQQ